MVKTYPLSNAMQALLDTAKSMAVQYNHARFSGIHLLKSLLSTESDLRSTIALLGIDSDYLLDWVNFHVENYPFRGNDEPSEDDSISAIMEEADLIRFQLKRVEIDPTCVLLAILKPGIAFSEKELASLNFSYDDLLSGLQETSAVAKIESHGDHEYDSKNDEQIEFCFDRTRLAKEGKLDPVVGRDAEVQSILEIFGRRGKSNVLIVGDPGVGKSALINALAQRIIDTRVPQHLKSATIIELDLKSLLAGATYKGELEERLSKILRSVKQRPDTVLFIDEFHALLESGGSGGTKIGDLIKPELTSGEFKLIAISTLEEYRKIIEPDSALMRRFEIVKVDEPDTQTCLTIIESLLPKYEEHHKMKLDRAALRDIIRLSKRYVADRRLPDSALDLIDRTFSAAQLINETAADEIKQSKTELDSLATTSAELSAAEQLERIANFRKKLKVRIGSLLYNQVCSESDETEDAPLETPEFIMKRLYGQMQQLEELAKGKKEMVDANDVAAIIAQRTGIPVGRLQMGEKEKLMGMDASLQKRVIGQDQAIAVLSDAIRESRSGLSQPGRPIGGFFLLGPTGTGKTETAKALASFLFDDEHSIIRFDMSEFKEEHSVSTLVGTSPGYVGYEEGGLLINRIRQKPYSIVLFDEIEKAHASVFDIFLQILDEGKLHDKHGKVGDFTNSVVLFTSNIGSDWIVAQYESGHEPDPKKLREIMGSHFRPEFLGRLTDIVPFRPLSQEHMAKIFDLQVRHLFSALEVQGIALEITPEAKQHLIQKGYSPKFGARPMADVIRQELRRPLSRMIIGGELTTDMTASVVLDDKEALSWNLEQSEAPKEDSHAV